MLRASLSRNQHILRKTSLKICAQSKIIRNNLGNLNHELTLVKLQSSKDALSFKFHGIKLFDKIFIDTLKRKNIDER